MDEFIEESFWEKTLKCTWINLLKKVSEKEPWNKMLFIEPLIKPRYVNNCNMTSNVVT